jgi:hypothetical protein
MAQFNVADGGYGPQIGKIDANTTLAFADSLKILVLDLGGLMRVNN